MLRRGLLRAAATLVAALLVPGLLGGTPVVAEETDAQPAPSRPLSGFFVSAGSTDEDNAAMLDQIRAVGGDTVVTFGSTLRTGSLDARHRVRTDGAIDPAFTRCQIDGSPCAQVATRGVTVNRVFTFANHSHLTVGAVRCDLDRTFTSGGQRYTLLLIPTQGTGCDSANGRYDLIAIHGGAEGAVDRTTSLLRTAEQAGVQVYVGMPSAQKRDDVAWLPDLSYRDTLRKFTHRFLRYHQAKDQNAALSGFYHHTEMPVAGGEVWQPVLDLYAMQNASIARVFPGRAALVSPYLDNRRSSNPGVSAEQLAARTQAGARRIAGTAGDVPLALALQDGMGTGKGGSYLVNDAGSPVDAATAQLVGEQTWESAFVMPVSDSFSAARRGLEGTGAALWANVEGMTPESGEAGCGTAERGQTTKNRLDQQVQGVGRYTAKNISYRWDPYFTCPAGGTSTLAQALTRHAQAPVVTNASLDEDRDLLWVSGYNLAGSTARVKYVDEAGQVRSAAAKVGVFSDDYGQRTGLDAGLQSADYPVDLVSPQEGKTFIVWVTGADGTPASRPFSLRH